MSEANELEQIRARHEADPYDRSQAVADRATLLRLLDAAREDLREVREAAGPFVELDKALPNWTGGTAINVTVYHVGAPTVIKGLLRVRDLRRLAAALKAPLTRAQGESS
jgi:hypothetical protein